MFHKEEITFDRNFIARLQREENRLCKGMGRPCRFLRRDPVAFSLAVQSYARIALSSFGA